MLCYGQGGSEVVGSQPERLPERKHCNGKLSSTVDSASCGHQSRRTELIFFYSHHFPALPTGPGEKNIVFNVLVKGLKLNLVPMRWREWTQKVIYLKLTTFKGFQNSESDRVESLDETLGQNESGVKDLSECAWGKGSHWPLGKDSSVWTCSVLLQRWIASLIVANTSSHLPVCLFLSLIWTSKWFKRSFPEA